MLSSICSHALPIVSEQDLHQFLSLRCSPWPEFGVTVIREMDNEWQWRHSCAVVGSGER